ncbi:glutathione hydrolase 1 proenzyme-like [Haliotis rubra]|uniref:glutathione hydrolase 1 proenzyme-like n=1 Tax=Haliotis rubra TaxID=36100 RepID=UPI001EE5CF24|nr:glutathione hydrolase 1 proenzyme-like [Haliotis rubra]
MKGEEETHKSSARRPLIYAILGGSMLIALGLAFGIGFGLRRHKPMMAPEKAQPEERKSKTGSFRFASVVSDTKQCSEVGTIVLAKGGSAVDAAIATALCSCVLNAQSCGLGGGFFMTVYNRASGTSYVLDARERAPLAANSTMYVGREKGASLNGGLAIAVPGELMGYWEAHQRFGKLPWKNLFEPTIKICREGIKVTEATAFGINRSVDLLRSGSFTMYFNAASGAAKGVGDTVMYPKLADTLETISTEGASAFYNGSLTDAIVSEIQENGGIITKEDLNEYTVSWRTPLTFTLRDGTTIHSMPAPGSGAVYAYILNVLDGYDLTTESVSSDDNSILTYHRIVEAFKFAYAKRTELGDEDFEDVAELMRNMTSREFGDATRARIDDAATHNATYYGATFSNQPDQGTSHISVVDATGNAVAITSTINYYFGSKVLGRTTGIMYNNEMDDFSTPGTVNVYGVPASPANFIKPGKRPLSSMCPTVVVDNSSDVILVLGGSGGTRITTAASLITLNTLKFGLSPGEALDRKRLHHQLLPPTLGVEDDFPLAVVNGLIAKGHSITGYGFTSVVNIVRVKDNVRHGACDVRKGGSAVCPKYPLPLFAYLIDEPLPTGNGLYVTYTLDKQFLVLQPHKWFWVRWGYGRIAVGKGNILGWDIIFDEEDMTGNVSILNVGQTSYNNKPYRIRLGAQERGRFKPEVGLVKWKDGLIIQKKVHLIQCSVACFQHIDCGMFSHNKGQGICELFNRTSSTFTVTSQNGWKSWKLLYC